jgi:hypothetical protein
VAFSPQANYTDWATATCRRNLMPTSVDKGMSRGQRGGSPTVVNLTVAKYNININQNWRADTNLAEDISRLADHILGNISIWTTV